ncbi:MAG: peptidylprolyl isomerase [Acidobacteriia bacterium]|nr:peptidylprolyl isomerase [Terriglobia bacterium]
MLTLCRWMVLIVFASLTALGQASAPAASNQTNVQTPARAAGAEVAPDTPIITVEGFCEKGSSGSQSPVGEKTGTARPSGASASSNSAADCRTVVTRAQFEKLVKDLIPLPTPMAKRQFAQDYPETLLFARQARELGIDKEPDFQEVLNFTILRTLSKMFVQRMQDQAQNISDAEVAQTYKEHPELFAEVDLVRIYVPKQKQHDSGIPSAADEASDEAAMRKVAEKIQAEAAAGGDFEKLQAEAYQAAGLSDPPDVNVGKETRGTMPLDYQQAAFKLQPGEVSQLVISPIGFHIFKITSKTTVPLSEAKRILQSLRFRESISAVKTPVKWKLNEAYFDALR